MHEAGSGMQGWGCGWELEHIREHMAAGGGVDGSWGSSALGDFWGVLKHKLNSDLPLILLGVSVILSNI